MSTFVHEVSFICLTTSSQVSFQGLPTFTFIDFPFLFTGFRPYHPDRTQSRGPEHFGPSLVIK